MATENYIQVKKQIDLTQIKQIKYCACDVYNEYEVIIFYDNMKSEVIDCEDEEETYQIFKRLKFALNEYVRSTKNLIMVGNGNIHYGYKVINVENIERQYIQSSKNFRNNQLGYSLYIVNENGTKEEIFFKEHIDAERLYHAIDYKKESFESDKIFNR